MACVLALLLLNFLRFDNPLEFGMRYQLMATRPPSELFALRHIPFSVVMYLFALPGTTDYFPFLLPSVVGALPSGSWGSEDVFGMLPLLPVLGLCAFSPMALSLQGVNKLVVALAAGFACVLVLLSMYFVVVKRYELDLAPMLAMLAAIGLLLVEHRWAGTFARRVALRTLLGASVLASLVMTVLAVCSHQPRRSTPLLSRIEMLSNAMALHAGWSPDSCIERFEIELMLPTGISPEREEVILTTGRSSYHNDVYLRRPDSNHVVIGLQGEYWKRAHSEPIAVDPAQPHTLVLEFGWLYPPPQHPYWSGIDEEEVIRLRSEILIVFDDEVLLDGHFPQWTADSATLVFGDQLIGDRAFTGTFLGLVQHKRSLK